MDGVKKDELYHKLEQVYDYIPASDIRMVMWHLIAHIRKQ